MIKDHPLLKKCNKYWDEVIESIKKDLIANQFPIKNV